MHASPPAGEMGSELATAADQQYYADAATFLAAQGDLANETAPTTGWFWWSFNANSMGERRACLAALLSVSSWVWVED